MFAFIATSADAQQVFQLGPAQISGLSPLPSSQIWVGNGSGIATAVAPGTATVTATGSTTARALADRFAERVNVKDYGAKGDGVTDDTTAIQAAINAANGATRVVYFPPSGPAYIVSSPLTVPLNMTGGAIFGDALQPTIIKAAASFAGVSMLVGNTALSVFRVSDLLFDANNVAGITKPLDFTRTPEGAIQNYFDHIRVNNAANGATILTLDGCEDTVVSFANLNFSGSAHGTAISWHVPGGNINILNSVYFEKALLSFQIADISNSTIGATYADGNAGILSLSNTYSYADTDSSHVNVGTTSTNSINTLVVTGGYWNPNGQNTITAISGKYGPGNSSITGLFLDGTGTAGYTMFSASTTAASGTPSFTLTAPTVSTASIGTPNAPATLYNNPPLGTANTWSALQTFSAGVATTTLSASGQITSTLATGTAPLSIASATLVPVLYVARAVLGDTVTTNANLTGPITSVGNATSVASQTGTGSTFVMNTSPTITTPIITSFTMLQGNSGSFAGGVWSRDGGWGTYYKSPLAGTNADIALWSADANESIQIRGTASGIANTLGFIAGGVEQFTLSATSAAFIPASVTMANLTSSAAALDAVCWNATGGVLTHNGAGALCSASLEELKDVIAAITPEEALAEIAQLRPFWGRFKDSVTTTSDHRVSPMLGAHAVEAIDSRLTEYTSGGDLHGVRYTNLTALFAAAIQGQQAQIDALRAGR